jgi:SAM-dependent methyltransferase
MTPEQSIIELGSWLKTAPGQLLLAWEQQRLDDAVADVFGFHALQLGLPELKGLRNNRMPHHWLGTDTLHTEHSESSAAAALHCEFDALPLPAASIDLLVLPHALEFARDAHQTLREAERVLVPEGRLVILGFNPASLWGLRQRGGHVRRGMGLNKEQALYLPSSGDFIGYWRLRDWLRLLSFEVDSAQFGLWRPPLKSELWLQRFSWMDGVAERWWPVLGAVYFIIAVKRVRGMRLVGMVKQDKRKARAAPAAVANREMKPPSALALAIPQGASGSAAANPDPSKPQGAALRGVSRAKRSEATETES